MSQVLDLVSWIGFLGGWLLFAGPVYQAALELQGQEIDRERIFAAAEGIAIPPPVSSWWWLLPPVAYMLRRRQTARYQSEVFSRLPEDEARAFVGFVDRAAGWLLVSIGALLIASKETWELVEHNDWPTWAFWMLWVGMGGLAVGYTILRIIRSRRVSSTVNGAPEMPL